MSIKSQKSLNEECSEIWEKSYSVRSPSEESLLSCPEDDSSLLARQLLSALTPAALSKLKKRFTKHQHRNLRDVARRVERVMVAAAAQEGIQFTERRTTQEGGWIDERGLVQAIEEIFGNHKYTTHAQKLFQMLDPFATKRISWGDLVDKLVEVGARKTRTRGEVWKSLEESKIKLIEMPHCKRETIVAMVSICSCGSFSYVCVTRGGRCGVYSGGFDLIHQYQLWYHKNAVAGRVKNTWATDAVYMPDVQTLVYSSSDRSLNFYDVSTLSHNHIYCISGMQNIPSCLAYDPSPSPPTPSTLLIGDERGNILHISHLQPRVSLFHNKYSDRSNSYFWMELSSPPHTTYVSLQTWRRVHTRRVVRIVLYHSQGITAVVSCSHDAAAVCVRYRVDNMPTYQLHVPRGVTCVCVSPPLRLVCGGARDGSVRLWTLSQRTPHAVLHATHRAPVQDVSLLDDKEIIVVLSRNCFLDIWDIFEECLLQTIKLRFPFLGVLGKKVEFGSYSLHPGPARSKPKAEAEEEDDDDVLVDLLSVEVPTAISRRSSVQCTESGGLALEEPGGGDAASTEASDCSASHSILVYCCNYVYELDLSSLAASPPGPLLPPPAPARRARRPTYWDLTDENQVLEAEVGCGAPNEGRVSPSPSASPRPQDSKDLELQELLHKAGLEDILQKDFVLMLGLKHDLNSKLLDLQHDMDSIASRVSVGAPYLACKLHDPDATQLDERFTKQEITLERLSSK